MEQMSIHKNYKQGELEIADWDPDYKVTEMTPLGTAKQRGDIEVINILIAAGARD